MNAIAPPSATAGPQLDNRRVLAALIDLAIVAAGVFVIGFVIGMASGGDGAEFGGPMNLIALAWALYYYFALESGDGQTIGKKVMKLRVVRADGGATSMREIAVRTVLRVIDGLGVYLVGLIVMLVTGKKRQRLGDLAAGTLVVDATATPTVPVAAVPAAPEAPTAPETQEPTDEPAYESPASESHPADSPADAPELAHSPIDVGSRPPRSEATERPDVPELTDFDPFSAPPAETTEPAAQAPDPQVEIEPQVEIAEEPQAETGEEPQVETAQEPQAETGEEPQVEPAEEPQAEESPANAYEPQVEISPLPGEAGDEPQVESSPAPVAELATEGPPGGDEADHGDGTQPPGLAPTAEAESLEDESVVVRSVDTVSPIDLVMGEDEAQGEDEDQDEDQDGDDSQRPGQPPLGA